MTSQLIGLRPERKGNDCDDLPIAILEPPEADLRISDGMESVALEINTVKEVQEMAARDHDFEDWYKHIKKLKELETTKLEERPAALSCKLSPQSVANVSAMLAFYVIRSGCSQPGVSVQRAGAFSGIQ